MAEHTPTPWTTGYPERLIVREVPGMCDGGDYYTVAEAKFHSLVLPEEAAANTAFILKAVNNHDALVQALQALVNNVNDYERVNNLAPSPGRTECWDTVAHAKRVLGAVGEGKQSQEKDR